MVLLNWQTGWPVVRELTPGGDCCTFLVSRSGGSNGAVQYVLKTLLDQRSPERRGMMFHQSAALRTLDHRGVAKWVESNADQFTTTADLYLVREYVKGADLETAVENGPMTVDRACEVVRRVLDTLKFCHARGVVHRGIKPSNVVLRGGSGGDPVLLDFGLTFNHDAAPTIDPATGRHIGDRFIYLPEDAGVGTQRRTDVSDLTQAAGLLLFLLTRQHPESLTDDRGRKPHERDAAARALAKLDPTHAEALGRLFDLAFADDPSRRWQSADALTGSLDAVLKPPQRDREPRELLAGRARTIRQRLGNNSEVSRQQAADRFAKDVVSWVSDTMNAVNAELKEVLSVGLLLSRPKQGTKKLSMTFLFTDRHDVKHKLECGVSTALDNQEMVLVAECMGRTGEIVRVGLHDPGARDVLRSAVETFLLDTAEHFASGSA